MKSKAFCIILPLTMFIMGCFTQSEIIKGELPQDDSKVLFHILDGSYTKSLSGNHHRLDNGYQINGEIVLDNRNASDLQSIQRCLEGDLTISASAASGLRGRFLGVTIRFRSPGVCRSTLRSTDSARQT